jgi:hypothetical protein
MTWMLRTALSMAKLDKEMSASELAAIAEHYRVERGPSLSMVDYASFLREVDIIFGTQVGRRDESGAATNTRSLCVPPACMPIVCQQPAY